MLERENTFYMAHQAKFQEKYLKWLIITGESLFGVHDTLCTMRPKIGRKIIKMEFYVKFCIDIVDKMI
jgi:hypothetical protein